MLSNCLQLNLFTVPLNVTFDLMSAKFQLRLKKSQF